METQLIKNLNNLRDEISNFERVCKKYKRGNNHYKNKLKQLKLNTKRFLKTNKLPKEIKKLMENFIEDEEKTSEKCRVLIDELDEKLQDLEIEFEGENEIFDERIYNENTSFDFHNDVRDIINIAKKEIFIVEPYIDEDLLEITLRNVNNSINIKILSNLHNPRGKFVKVSNKFISQHKGNFDARETDKVHDRGIFIDGVQGWVVGQSLKQGGKKPTYIIKLKNPKKLESVYNKIFLNSKKIK